MIKNGVKALWNDNKPAINGWLSIASAFSAEIYSAQGYDSVTVDIQHGIIDYTAAVSMLQGMRANNVTPIVRVPWLDPAAIMKAMDAGAYGIICPMINSRAQAEQLVSYMRYPPNGTRSFGPARALFSAGANYVNEANDEILCLAMIETAEAMDNLDQIVSTPGLDGVYIGPSDLSLGITDGRLGPGFDREEPELLDAIHRVLKAAKDANIRAGIHCGSPEYASKAVGWGFDLVTLSNDVRLLSINAAKEVAKMRELLAAAEQGSGSS